MDITYWQHKNIMTLAQILDCSITMVQPSLVCFSSLALAESTSEMMQTRTLCRGFENSSGSGTASGIASEYAVNVTDFQWHSQECGNCSKHLCAISPCRHCLFAYDIYISALPPECAVLYHSVSQSLLLSRLDKVHQWPKVT